MNLQAIITITTTVLIYWILTMNQELYETLFTESTTTSQGRSYYPNCNNHDKTKAERAKISPIVIQQLNERAGILTLICLFVQTISYFTILND